MSSGAKERRSGTRLGRTAAAVGKGIFAGFAGTAAMTAGQLVEMKLRGRKGSTTPGDLVCGLLGVVPEGDAERERFSGLVHWTRGTGWGVLRGLLGAAGLRGVPALAADFAIIMGGDFVLLTARGVAPAPWRWTREDLAVEALHKGVLATATHLAYQQLDR
ncbi:hypothetical protein GCM10025787_01570 [Saccharopolyspora rosea]